MISCIHIQHSIIHPHVKFQRNQANINIVIGIQRSLSHIHWPLFKDEKEESVEIRGGVCGVLSEVHSSKCRLGQSETSKIGENPDHLRFCKTAITWLWSLSAILPLFWRHGIANFPAFAAKTWEMLLWLHEIHDVFPRNLANALQNLQFSHYFTMKFDIFSLNSTWDSDFLKGTFFE